MSQTVEVPGVGELEFPDGMSQTAMASAIQKNFPHIHSDGGSQPAAPEPSAASSPGWWQRLQLPPNDPNSVENTMRRTLGAPAVGANPEYEKALSADSPFPDVLPVAPNTLKNLAGAAMAPVKYLLRGGDGNAPAIAKTIDNFAAAGTTPSVGQATGSRIAQATESLLGKYPGGAGVMANKAETQASEIGDKVQRIADRLSINATPFVAGRTIEKGLSGPGGFVDRFKQGQKALYDRLDDFIKPQTPVDVTNTSKALASMNEDIQGAEALSRFFKNGKIQDIESALKSDTAGTRPGVMVVPENPFAGATGAPKGGYTVPIPGGSSTNQLPYEAMKKLRTLVGNEITDGLAADVPRSKFKALYAALSKDLDAAAVASGPDATKAMQRANAFARAGHARIDDILDSVAKKGAEPEKLFASAVSPSDMQAGASKISAVMKSLSPSERDVVKSAFVRRMGLANAGAQNAEGDAFSSSTFLTNWNRMSPQAKNVMFSSKDGNLRASLDAIAKTADRIKQGGKVLSNPSGTAPVVAATGLVSSVGAAIGTGNPQLAAGLLTSAAGANLTARLMTNPRFVSWLARATKIQSVGLARQAVLSLGKTMQGEPSDVQDDAQRYAKAAAPSFVATPAAQ
ncbi:hypothetical protein G3N58_17040 [Paraburkholderia sp. Ac-20342]|uniref:hypothetical protein n=1 Tax=Paraburkholderia sp. Ac-20342 TaxID=2703889 RepID=UPI00197D56BB|nr:hypothetical protein [Paraburkholderia sp. Ac-20342]MBN3848519.1 hypothetical protein [Paraburkholderia sp. Ac-20342]